MGEREQGDGGVTDERRAPDGVLGAGRQVWRQSMRDDVIGLAAELAYRFFLSLFPFFIFLAALGGLLASQLPIENPAEQAVELLGDALPEEAAGTLQAQLENIIENHNTGALSLGALLALIFATGGTNAIIKAMDRVYSVRETRPLWKRYLIALTMTMVAGAAIIGAFLLIVPLRIFGAELAQALGLAEETGTLITFAGVGVAFMLVVLAAAYVYRVAPNIELPFSSVLIGALLFAVAWVAGTIGFFFWVTQFGDYAGTYGALAGVAILLIWFYLSAFIFLVAAQVNEVLHEVRFPEDVENRRRRAEVDDAAQGEAERGGSRRATREQRRHEEADDEDGAATA